MLTSPRKNIDLKYFFIFLSLLVILSFLPLDTWSHHCTGAVGNMYDFCGGDWSRDIEYFSDFDAYSILIRPTTLLAPILYDSVGAYDSYHVGFAEWSRISWAWIETIKYQESATVTGTRTLPITLWLINFVYLIGIAFLLQLLWTKKSWWRQ